MGIVLVTYYEWSQLRFGIKQKSFSHSHKTTLSFIFTLKGRNAVKLVCCELKAGRRTDDIREREIYKREKYTAQNVVGQLATVFEGTPLFVIYI